MAANPLRAVMQAWLPELDFAVLRHGFADHGRDYLFLIQAGGTYELILTHVVEMHYETRVRDDVWSVSWDDCLIDYAEWQAAGEPDGYVWGSNWSLAYPGLEMPDDDPAAAGWTTRAGKSMHAMAVETDRFRISMVFHDARSNKISDDNSIIDRVLIPLGSYQGRWSPLAGH
ncbi:MAG TPA: hypothetical protein VKY24_17880 [Reyranella sp.]|nr:hypothetical protein [Reyranella sp.]